ncbi:MAG: DUF4392 domain-containing protein [Proteobacteria bacterium]|nr:DUF4392 domain-containing protein [Pseudomonadota bacterium]
MSPRVNELAAIEAVVCRDVGRKTQPLIDATRGELGVAAAALLQAKSIGLITGFFVPRDEVMAPETDGPVGTALLAVSLAACGVPVRIAVDSPCADVVRMAVREAGGTVAVDEVGVDDRPGIDRVIDAWRRAGTSHVVAIERCGLARDGRPRNMRGVDVSPWTAPLDNLFSAGPWVRIGVGDGGNEIGMGKLPADLIAAAVPNGERIACVTGCDHLIVAGVSNWGAYGLMTALALLRESWAATIGKFLTTDRDLRVTRAIAESTGAVDGVTGRREATVDGFGPEIHAAVIADLRRIAWGKRAD